VSDSPQSVNFLLYQPGSVLRIPLTYENAELSVDLRRGCFVAKVNRYVECVCTGDVPNYLNVDLTGREKNDVIRIGSIVFPPGVRPHKTVTDDFVIAVIQSTKKA
jgi:large subunit ribosomal protein L25